MSENEHLAYEEPVVAPFSGGESGSDAPPVTMADPGHRLPRLARFGAFFLLLGAIQFVAAMAIAQAGWTTSFSLLNNQISDLGSAHCGYAYGGLHYACSPWHDVFNASAILLGVALILGAFLIRDTFALGRSRAVGLFALALAGVGAVGVGVFPWDVAGAAHYPSALAAFLFGDLALIALGTAMVRGTHWSALRTFSIVSGVVGLVALVVYLVLFFGNDFGAAPGTGAVERVAVAPLLIWLVAVGASGQREAQRSASLIEGDDGRQKGYRGLAMEGTIARQYSKARRSERQLSDWRRQAALLTSGLADGAHILEVAPGPGYFAIELARIGRFHVSGLDISRTFVQLAQENARAAGVAVAFRLGDAARMPYVDATFDLVVCQAAFKNFSRPERAIQEIHRVLRPGGTAVIEDLRKDASDASIRDEVRAMRLGPWGAFVTQRILGGLRRRAYTREQFQQMATHSEFGGCEVTTSGIAVDVRLRKRSAPA